MTTELEQHTIEGKVVATTQKEHLLDRLNTIWRDGKDPGEPNYRNLP